MDGTPVAKPANSSDPRQGCSRHVPATAGRLHVQWLVAPEAELKLLRLSEMGGHSRSPYGARLVAARKSIPGGLGVLRASLSTRGPGHRSHGAEPPGAPGVVRARSAATVVIPHGSFAVFSMPVATRDAAQRELGITWQPGDSLLWVDQAIQRAGIPRRGFSRGPIPGGGGHPPDCRSDRHRRSRRADRFTSSYSKSLRGSARCPDISRIRPLLPAPALFRGGRRRRSALREDLPERRAPLGIWRGRPVVTTDAGGLGESVDEGKSGYVVPPRDAAALAHALVKVLEPPQRAAEMGAYARELAETRYSWAGIATRTGELYLSPVSSCPGERHAESGAAR